MEMEEEEKRKIREFLKKVDKKYYRPDIKERKSLSEEMVNAAEEAGGNNSPFGRGEGRAEPFLLWRRSNPAGRK